MREAQTQEFRSVLGHAGLRSTAAALEVLAVFSNAQAQLLTHSEVQIVLERRNVFIDKATLYCLLDRLVTAGVLHKVVEPDRKSWFGWSQGAAKASPVAHPRFVCRACNRRYQLADLPDALGRAVEQAMAQWKTLGHQGLEAEIAIRGLCKQCVPH